MPDNPDDPPESDFLVTQIDAIEAILLDLQGLRERIGEQQYHRPRAEAGTKNIVVVRENESYADVEFALSQEREQLLSRLPEYKAIKIATAHTIKMISGNTGLKDPTTQHPNQPSSGTASPLKQRLRRIRNNAVAEFANTVLFLLGLAGAGWLTEHLFGERMLFGKYPISYLFDAGDVAVFGRFIWNTLKPKQE